MGNNARPAPGQRVLVTEGPHAGATGTVRDVLNGPGTPLDRIPEDSPQRYPYWYVTDLGDNGTVRLTKNQFAVTDGQK